MSLKAYALGDSLIAAVSPANAISVMEKHEPVGKWSAEQARELADEELALPIDEHSHTTVADELARSNQPRLLRWAYPA